MKQCRECSVELVVGENWYASMPKSYKCKLCVEEYKLKWRDKHPERYLEIHKKGSMKNAKSKGEGIYQILLNDICLYVDEGQLEKRKVHHITATNQDTAVLHYCVKHNINRKLLSFNVLEYENDIARRKQIEDWYITFLMPVINSKPPLGLYV